MSSMFCTKIYKCKNVDWCARDFNPKSDEPKCFEPMTNADRIRAMDIDHLIEWFCRGRPCGTCPYGGKVECGIREWLQQEAQ